MIQFSVGMIRMLNGAPLAVLVALSIDRQPHSANWLEAVTGYSDKPVATALAFLAEMGFVSRNGRYSWQLADGIQQLPLGATMLEEPDSEKFRVGENPSPHDVVNINTESVKNTSSNNNGDSENLRVQENLDTLAAIGVSEPKRSRLARLPGVNSRMIRYNAHCAAAARSARNPTGLAISLIERGSQAPDNWVDPDWEAPAAAPPPGEERAPAEELLPLPPELAEAWTRAVAELPIRRVDRLTWLPAAQPVGVSTETPGQLVVRVASSITGEWIAEHVKADLEAQLKIGIRLEGPHG